MIVYLPNMKLTEVLWLFSILTINIEASTHWMVTESGLIQPRAESPFELDNPSDFTTFAQQDARWDDMIDLYHDLGKRIKVLSGLWSEMQEKSDISTFIESMDSCNKAGDLSYIDWYATMMEQARPDKIPDDEYLLYKPSIGQDVDVPDCKKISSLTFSMFTFEHLEGMRQRDNLTSNPELALPSIISPIMTVDQFGHWLCSCLKKNSSSWLHYNMAAMYWRARGSTPKAIECSRRAVHYSPREYKDIPLLNLGSLLHRSKRTEDAITVLAAAVDHNEKYYPNHFVLATAYAVLGDYNNSIKYLNIARKLDPRVEFAHKYRYGVLCHAALAIRLNALRDIAQKLHKEVNDMTVKESKWVKLQINFLMNMKHYDKNSDFRNLLKNAEKMTEMTGLDMLYIKKQCDRYSVVQYFLEGSVSITEKLRNHGVHALDSAYSLQRLVNHIEKHATMVENYDLAESDKMLEWNTYEEKMSTFGDTLDSFMLSDIKVPGQRQPDTGAKQKSGKEKKRQPDKLYSEYFVGSFLYVFSILHFFGNQYYRMKLIRFPSTMKVNRNTEDFDRENVWPTNRFCKETAPTFPPKLEVIYPVFLPFENKGISIYKLLSEKIGVSVRKEYELPWYPPTCPQDKEALAFTNKKSKQQMPLEVEDTGHLRHKLLEYVTNGDVEAAKNIQDAEIGHRIFVAMKQKLVPKWVLFTLSSLYWRVRGNKANALHCLLSASKKVETKYKDLVQASLGSVLLEMGYFEESMVVTEEAFKHAPYEPVLNFLLSQLNMLRKHRNAHMFHLKQVVRVDPGFMNGLARRVLNGWACILKQINTVSEIGFSENVCTQVEPGINMICLKDGSGCHVTNIECPPNQERDTSTVTRLLGVKEKKVSPDILDDNIFNAFKENMPADRANIQSHQQNFDMMVRTVETTLKGCGRRGCKGLDSENMLSEEDCSLQYMDLGYWLHTISFRQMIIDGSIRLPAEVNMMTAVKGKVPDCRMPPNPTEDFFLEKFTGLDTNGWRPILSLMHQFTDFFDFRDFPTLGAKIAKFIEVRSDSWEGLVAAGWWCGSEGRALCAVRCLASAHKIAPPDFGPQALRAMAVLLSLQSKRKDAKDLAYLSFYTSPKNKIDSFILAIAHSYLEEYEQAIWMYRYALTFDSEFLPAKACLHFSLCNMLYGDLNNRKKKF